MQYARAQSSIGSITFSVILTLLILSSNPVYTAPADLDFAQALQKVPLRAHHGLFEDETSEYCHWHVPAAHVH
mgnify:CR=1 FL=1